MKIKPGVDLRGLQPQMAVAAMIAEGVWAMHGKTELTITSGAEGKHMTNSLHYKGLAIDIRLPSADPAAAVLALRANLGAQFDVVLEVDHIHLEFDPKEKDQHLNAP